MRAALVVAWVLAAAPALARPTSGDMSIVSGRTMGVGEEAIAAGLGWPGIWAEYLLAPSSTFNVGFRGTVLYGSPVMGLGSGVGAEATVPLRFHLWGADLLDVALQLEPSAFIGEGALAEILGQAGVTLAYKITPLLRKDSLELTDADRADIRAAVAGSAASHILITHGTDTMVLTARALAEVAEKTNEHNGSLQLYGD